MPQYQYQHETTLLHNRLDEKCVSRESNHLGMTLCEPVIVILDSLLRYAKAFAVRHNKKIKEEPWLCDYYLDTLKGIRRFLDYDGAVAMERDRSTDSKDNGVCESLFWHAARAAGFIEKDMNL